MKAASFAYLRPADLDSALDALAEHGEEAKVLAGGQSLVPMLNLRLARPGVLVDINRIGLDEIALDGDVLVLGGLVRHVALERDPVVAREAPLLARAAPLIGHAAIRNRGTVAGSLAHADPAAELGAVALALDAVVVARSAGGERAIPATELFESPFSTTLRPDELITAVRFPRHGSWACAYQEMAIRAGDFAVAGAAVVLRLADGERVGEARIALSGVAGVPVRATEAEAVLTGAPLDEEHVAAAARAAADAARPSGDVHGSADYRRHLAGVLTRRALLDAARGGP